MAIGTFTKTQDMQLRSYQSISSAYASESSGGGGGGNSTTSLVFSSFGDDNDVFYHIASDGKTIPWGNPHPSKVVVSVSPPLNFNAPDFVNGNPASICDRASTNPPAASTGDANAYVLIDLGANRSLSLTDLCVQQRDDNADGLVRGLKLEGGNNPNSLSVVFASQSVSSSRGQWSRHVVSPTPPFRYFKLSQAAQNSSQSYVLVIGELALYGALTEG